MSLYYRDEPAPRDVEAHREAIEHEDADCLANGEPEELTEREAADLEAAFRARHVTGADNWRQPRRWNAEAQKAGRRARVFCASLADVFEDHPAIDASGARARLWDLIQATPWLDWLLLTKRPQNMRRFAPEAWRERWPDNVWAGTTVEDQEHAEERIPHLLQVPARVRFLSVEPMLEAVDLERWIAPHECCGSCGHIEPGLRLDDDGHPIDECMECGDSLITTWGDAQTERWESGERYENGGPHEEDERLPINWVICGGESGHKARPFDLRWARQLRDQCGAAGVPFFMKQMGALVITDDAAPWPGGNMPCERLDEVGARIIGQGWRVRLKDKAGADPSEWPADLRVQEFPR